MKLLIIKNNVKKIDIDRGMKWFSDNGIKFTYDIVDANETFRFLKTGNGKVKGEIPNGDDIRAIVDKYAGNKYDFAAVLHDNDVKGIRVSCAYPVPTKNGVFFVQTHQIKDGGKTLNHELIHAMFHKLISMGIKVEDPMDFVTINGVQKAYYNDSNMKAKHSNRTIALERLAPHITKLSRVSMSPDKFDVCVKFVLKEEGGYVNDPHDPGGETKFGISKRAFPKLDIKKLTTKQAEAIYRANYWVPVQAENFDLRVSAMLFDISVNMGLKTAVRAAQEVCGAVVDGVMGPKTIKAMQKMDQTELLANLTMNRIARYTKMKNFDRFGKGWINRTIRCYNI